MKINNSPSFKAQFKISEQTDTSFSYKALKKALSADSAFCLNYGKTCVCVCLNQLVAHGNDFIGGKLGTGEGIHHSCLINVVFVAGVSSLNGQQLGINVGGVHSGKL